MRVLKMQDFRKEGLVTVAIGVAFLAVGGIITAATFSAASSGGHFVVTTGLFLVGIVKVVQGIWRTLFD
jgi:predicted phage tail protein